MVVYDSREELLRLLERDAVAISSALAAEGLQLSPQRVSETGTLTLDTNKSQAQKLADHILRERETRSEWYRKFLSLLSRHEWLAEIITALNDMPCELI